MKTIISLLILTGVCFAQQSDTQDSSQTRSGSPNLSDLVNESQRQNEILYDSASQSSKHKEKTKSNPSADSAVVATPQGNRSQQDLNLTDEERRLSEDYVHDGKALREQKEKCDQLGDPNACRGQEVNSKFLGIDASMIKTLSKMYSMVMGPMESTIEMGNAKSEASDVKKPEGTDKAGASGEKAQSADKVSTSGEKTQGAEKTDASGEKTEEKDRKDWCKYLAIGVEGVAFVMQQASSKNAEAPSSGETAQKNILYKAAKSHKDRSKINKYQTVGWGATTACYVYMMSTGANLSSFSNWAKLGASALMTGFFRDQYKDNNKYYKEVKAIADSLPGKGDCNPVTDRDCYCAQEETENDPKYCLPQFHNNKLKPGAYRVACLDSNGKADLKCTCVDQNRCFDKKFTQEIQSFGFGNAFNQAALKPISNLSRGQLTRGDIASAETGALNAISRRIPSLSSKAPAVSSLSRDQQRSTKSLIQRGVPKKIAGIMSSRPLLRSARSNSRRFRGSFARRPKSSLRRATRNNVLRFSNNKRRSRRGNRKSPNQFNQFMNKFKGKKKPRSRSKILNYQNKAMKSADINKNKDRSVFEIISRRYQVSGLKRLDIK